MRACSHDAGQTGMLLNDDHAQDMACVHEGGAAVLEGCLTDVLC